MWKASAGCTKSWILSHQGKVDATLGGGTHCHEMLAADEFYDVKPCIDLSELDLKKGLETFSGRDMQQTSHVEIFRQIFCVLKMDASMPVDSRVFMQQPAMRKYLAACGLTDVVNQGDLQYTLNHGKVLVDTIAAGTEPLEFRCKVESEIRFNLVVHDPDALFNIINQQRRDRAVIEANDVSRRKPATRRDGI